jgi:hypothetical protein
MTTRRIEHAPVTPMSEKAAWAKKLKEIATTRLEFRPEFPEVAARHEAWWRQEMIDRPLMTYDRVKDPMRKFSKHFDLLLDEPERWLEESFADMAAVERLGDELPNIRVDFGPVMTGGLLGARTEFGSETTWTHAFIDDDWSNAPEWRIDERGRFWTAFTKLMTMTARHARGRYLVRTPDYGGSADVLLNIRGSEGLCIDCLEKPGVVKDAVDAIYPLWHRQFTETYRRTLAEGAGLIHWIGLWSNEPYMIPACDFNYLIGPKEFDRLFLPDIARECATVGRAVFHLDGPGAAKHIDALLEIPELTAIQYVTGAGTPSALPWIEMYRKIQRKRRSLVICCPPSEILTVLDQIEPEGVIFTPFGGDGWDQLDDIFKTICRRFGCPC